MNASTQTFTRVVLTLGGLGYFLILVTALVLLHMPPDIVLTLTVGGIALTVIALRPYVGVHAFLALLFFENALGAREGLTPMKLLGGIILAGWLLSLMARQQTGMRMNLLALALVAFVAWSGFCLLYAIDASIGLTRLFQYVQLGLAALMFASVLNTPARTRGVLVATVLWTFLSTVIAIVQYYAGITPMAMGLVGNRNLLAIYINLAVVCVYLLHQVTKDALGRVALLATLPVFFLGLGLTFSRGGLISMGVVLLLVSWRVMRRRDVLVVLGSLVTLTLMTFVFPTQFFERARSIVPAIRNQEDTFGMRVQLSRVALRMARDRPLFGVGPGNYNAACPRYARGGETMACRYSTHNTFTAVAAESGVPGLLLLLMVTGLALREAHRTVRHAQETGSSEVEMIAVAVEVNLIALLIASLSGNTEASKVLWITLGMALSLCRLREARVPGRRLPPVPHREGAGIDLATGPAGTAVS